MHEIGQVVFDVWAGIKRRLLDNPDELRARLARRRLPIVAGPPRSSCIALRASDRRINPGTVEVWPYEAGWPVSAGEHELRVEAGIVRRVCALQRTEESYMDVRELAERMGVTPQSLMYQRRKLKRYEEKSIKGLWGRWGPPVPVVRSDELLDPGSGNAFRLQHYAWGGSWTNNAERFPAEFEQVLRRVPVMIRQRRGEPARFRGWRWICPGCGLRVRTIYFPLRLLALTEWTGEEEQILRAAGTSAELDGIVRPTGTFACHACHGVRFYSPIGRSGWNHLVAHLSAGLLYGHEVKRPDDLPQRDPRRRAKKSRVTSHPRRDEVERLLKEGKKYAEVAKLLGVKLSTVQGHVKRLYKQRGIHKKRHLSVTTPDA